MDTPQNSKFVHAPVFTGERVIPGLVEPDLWNEHVARYHFARSFAAGKSVLDVACGTGYGTHLLAAEAKLALGFDIAEDAISYATTHYGPQSMFLVASADAFPVGDRSFDLITAFEVIEHLTGWKRLILEAARALTPEGIFLVSTPNRAYYQETRKEVGPNPFHFHEFEADEFASELSAVFPFVRVLAQNQQELILFAGGDHTPDGQAFISSAPPLPDAHFFLAACALQPIHIHPFAYVPSAGNLLRERERHIASLKAELADVRAEQMKLLDAHRKLEEEFDARARWALSRDAELDIARDRLAQLERELEECRRPLLKRLVLRVSKRMRHRSKHRP
jgi:SAM-dependent methyltransferase